MSRTELADLKAKWRTPIVALVLAMSSMLIAGCEARSQSAKAAAPRSADVKEFREFNLTIYGYNYTDTEIGSLKSMVGGAGIWPSAAVIPGDRRVFAAPPCTHHCRSTTRYESSEPRWGNLVRAGRTVSWARPSDSEYLEVHFYRDGHIEIASTAEPSPPRVRLDRLHGNSRHSSPELNVNNDSKFSRCARGYNR